MEKVFVEKMFYVADINVEDDGRTDFVLSDCLNEKRSINDGDNMVPLSTERSRCKNRKRR